MKLEREQIIAKIKGDAGVYSVWAIDWLNLKVQVYRAMAYEWIDMKKVKLSIFPFEKDKLTDNNVLQRSEKGGGKNGISHEPNYTR